jgi:hypothetical protein
LCPIVEPRFDDLGAGRAVAKAAPVVVDENGDRLDENADDGDEAEQGLNDPAQERFAQRSSPSVGPAIRG